MSNEQHLESFIDLKYLFSTLIPNKRVLSMYSYDKSLIFFQEILINSQLPQFIDALFWIAILLFYNGLVIFISLPLTWFLDLFPATDDLNESLAFLRANILIVRFTICIIVISAIIVLYQWYKWYSYVINSNHLSTVSASLLHFTFVHAPLFLVPVLGILLGANTLSNSSEYFNIDIANHYCIVILLCFMGLVFNQMIYFTVTRYSLIIRRKYISYWQPPANFFDYLYMLFISCFITLRNQTLGKFLTIPGVLSIFYAIYNWVYHQPRFISAFPNFLYLKMSVDSFVFGITTIVYAWANINTRSMLTTSVILYFLDICVAGYAYFNSSVVQRPKVGSSAQHNQKEISNSLEAITSIRSAITYCSPSDYDIEFLQWLLVNRFSVDLICEVVRICVATNQPVKKLIIPNVNFSTAQILSLKFLSLQYYYIRQSYKSQDDSFVQATCLSIKKEISRLNNLFTIFWTDKDYEHLTILHLGQLVNEMTNAMALSYQAFPQSESIRESIDTYANEVVCKPSIKTTKIQKSNFNAHVFNIMKHDHCSQNDDFVKTTTENYIDKVAQRGVCPLHVFFWIMYVLMVISFCGVAIFTFEQSNRTLDNFVSIGEVLKFVVTISNSALNSIDSKVVYPDPETLTRILGISESMAINYRSYIIPLVSFNTNLSIVFGLVEHGMHSKKKYAGGCDSFNLYLLSTYQLNLEKTPIDLMRCFLISKIITSGELQDSLDSLSDKFSKSLGFSMKTVGIYASVFVIVSFILFFIIFGAIDRPRYHRMSLAVRHIFATQGKSTDFEKMDISFTFTCQFFIYFIMICSSGASFLLLIYPIIDNHQFISQAIAQTDCICSIISNINSALSLALLPYLNTSFANNTIESLYLTEVCSEIDKKVVWITTEKFLSIFQTIPPFDHWISKGTNSFSSLISTYSNLLTGGNFTNFEDFRIQFSRYIFYTNFSILYEHSLLQMINSAHLALQQQTTPMWLSSVVFLLIATIAHFCFIQLSIRKSQWYNGASLLLRRAIAADNQNTIIIRNIIEKLKPDYFEEIPSAVIIRNEHGRILYVNTQTKLFVKSSINQMIGQPLSQFFDIENEKAIIYDSNGNKKLLDVDIHPFGDDLELIIISDKTKLEAMRAAEYQLYSRMKPNLDSFPSRDENIYVEIRFIAEVDDPSSIYQSLKAAEEILGSSVARISCGITFYTALIKADTDQKKLMQFLVQSVENAKTQYIIAVTKGVTTTISLAGDGTLVVVCGPTAKRAHDCIVFGFPGKVYIDYGIFSQEVLEKTEPFADKIMEIGPITHE